MTLRQKTALILWFYVGWFGCIFFAKWQISRWSLVFPLLPFVFLLKFKLLGIKEVGFLFGISIIGIIFDWIVFRLNVVSFPGHSSMFIPLWLDAMWFLFSTVVPLSHALFKSKLWLAVVLGALLGPLSYFSGISFEVLAFQNQSALIVYAAFWGIYFPVIHYFYGKVL